MYAALLGTEVALDWPFGSPKPTDLILRFQVDQAIGPPLRVTEPISQSPILSSPSLHAWAISKLPGPQLFGPWG
ncbi:hypothetical protein U1Q18_039091 [Sarracenia purpurea var. burkii]